MRNIIEITPQGQSFVLADAVYQYSRGMILKINDPSLPTIYRVEIANEITGTADGHLATDGKTLIPLKFFIPGKWIHCWIVPADAESAVPALHIVIPVSIKARYVEQELDPEEQSMVDELIAALDAALNTARHIADTAGYMEFEINASGHLIYTRTDATDVDFAINPDTGHLMMEVV